MRLASLKRPSLWRSAINVIAGSRTRAWMSILALLTVSALLTAVVRAYNHSASGRVSVTKSTAALPSVNQGGSRKVRYYDRLGLQPSADRMRRKLGRRFQESVREITESTGTLTIGKERHAIVIVRTRDDDGERVSIGLDGGPLKYTWNGSDGSQSQGKSVTENERSLIERVALDSPEQFVLAQLRGAGYYTAARGVRPAAAGASDDYNGPIWDVIQVSEPDGSRNKPESASRLYYVNNSTGLIDRTTSRDRLGVIETEFSDWATLDGDLVPLRTTWTLDKRVIMELVLSTVVNRAKN